MQRSRNPKSLAEIVLRVGAGVGGWVIAFAYGIVLVVLPIGACTDGGDEAFRGTFILAVMAGLTALLLGLSMPWKRSLRWMALLSGALLVWALYRIAPFFVVATLDGAHLCRDLAPETLTTHPEDWHRYWTPFQFAVVGVLLWQAIRTLRPVPDAR